MNKEIKYKDFFDHLMESPLELGGTYDNDQKTLSDPMSNSKQATYIETSKKPIDKYKEYVVYNTTTTNGVIVDFFIKDGRISSVIRYTKDGNSVRSETVWQNKEDKGLVRDLILNFYLKKYDGWVTNSYVSKMGKSSVIKLISDAIKSNFSVYVLNKNIKEKRINSEEDVLEYFGKVGNYYDYVFLIEKGNE